MSHCLAILLILTATRLCSAHLDSFEDKDIHQKENESEQQNIRVRQCSIEDANSGWGLLTPHAHQPATPHLKPAGVTLDSGSQTVTRNKKQKSRRFAH